MAQSSTLTPNQQDRRRRILVATRELVGRHGYNGMIMSEVATQAGVSPTTLYNLYNTKDELLLESLREQMTESWAEAHQALDRPGYEYLLQLFQKFVQQAREAPAYAQAIVQALLRANASDALVDTALKGGRDDVLAILTTMAGKGEIQSDADLEAVTITLIGMFWSCFMLWNKGMLTLEVLEDAVIRNYLSTLIPIAHGATKAALEARYLCYPGRAAGN